MKMIMKLVTIFANAYYVVKQKLREHNPICTVIRTKYNYVYIALAGKKLGKWLWVMC